MAFDSSSWTEAKFTRPFIFSPAEVGGFCNIPGECLCHKGFGPPGLCNEGKITITHCIHLIAPELCTDISCAMRVRFKRPIPQDLVFPSMATVLVIRIGKLSAVNGACMCSNRFDQTRSWNPNLLVFDVLILSSYGQTHVLCMQLVTPYRGRHMGSCLFLPCYQALSSPVHFKFDPDLLAASVAQLVEH